MSEKELSKVTSMQELQAAVATKYEDIAKQISSKISAPSGNTIRLTANKKFVLPDGSETDGPIRVVILGFSSRNTYYSSAYSANNLVPPDCYAEDDSPADMSPATDAHLIQAESCNECPQNEWGSSANGNGKACQNTRIIALLPPDDSSAEIQTIRVSPGGLKNFDSYMAKLATLYKLPPFAVTTEISFDQKESYSKLIFDKPEPNSDFDAFGKRAEDLTAVLAANFPARVEK